MENLLEKPNEFTEIEYKYRANNISLSNFIDLMNQLDYIRREDISSWDIYYKKDEEIEEFQRLRLGEKPELTKKRKHKTYNNWTRVEVDLPLDHNRLKEETVKRYLELDGYIENFRIYKSCFIFWTEDVNITYYVTFDRDMKERDRFIEIEVNKSKMNTITKAENLKILKDYEDRLVGLGINPQNRLKKSLWELYKI